MKIKSVKHIIVGAGLSGLTSAYHLLKNGVSDFLVLEARNRIGGRICTANKIDFGATWFQDHHYHVSSVVQELCLSSFDQYAKGKSVLVYSTMAPAHYFESDPNTVAAQRIVGNSQALIKALARSFVEKIHVDTVVEAIVNENDGLRIKTDKGVYEAEKIILTLPPKIATRIDFTPELPEEVRQVMGSTHTWMSNAIKVGLTFKTPFWRTENLSGTVIGQVGAVTELYDHSDAENSAFALMGFVNEGLRDCTVEERKKRILAYLSKYLGSKIMEYASYEEKDWSQDKNTSCETIKSVYMSPSYGNPIFKKDYFDGKLVFSGAETSPVYGGYMDGAVYSGILAAKKVIG